MITTSISSSSHHTSSSTGSKRNSNSYYWYYYCCCFKVSWLFLLLLRVFILQVILTTSLVSTQQYQYQHQHQQPLSYHKLLFPSEYESFDPWTFDPNNMYGSPYGGFGRATKSRLAAMSLRLVTLDTTTSNNSDTSASSSATTSTNNNNSSDQVYFTIMDGEGQKFACTFYNEHDLQVSTLADSLFDIATMRVEDHDDDDQQDIITIEEEEEDNTNTNTNNNNDDEDVKEKEPQQQTQTISKTKIQNTINQIMTNLNGYCAQYTKDYWSYEWCHEVGLVQFHLSTLVIPQQQQQQQEEDEGKQPPPRVQIENITPVGLFKHRLIVIPSQVIEDNNNNNNNNNNNDDDYYDDDDYYNDDGVETKKITSSSSSSSSSMTSISTTTTTTSNFIEIIDTYSDGQYCDKVEKQREVKVHLTCCKDLSSSSSSSSSSSQRKNSMYQPNQFAKLNNGIVLRNTSRNNNNNNNNLHTHNGIRSKQQDLSQSNFDVILQKIEEENICEYTATVCTTLLCDPIGDFEVISSLMDGSIVNNSNNNSNNNSDDNSDDNNNENHPSMTKNDDHNNSHKGNNKNKNYNSKVQDLIDSQYSPQIQLDRNESIRNILDRTLTNCLTVNFGWWTYRYCHLASLYQYHEEVYLDPRTSQPKANIGTRYNLGKYDPQSKEEYPEERYLYLPSRTNNNNVVVVDNTVNDDDDDDEVDNDSIDEAYFFQEYYHGDVCEDSDVVDSAIKGGKYGDGKIERSSTIRFFCGNQKTILRVNEDSTCHYIVDISIPELCLHKYFEVPHLQTQVVKCLPVD